MIYPKTFGRRCSHLVLSICFTWVVQAVLSYRAKKWLMFLGGPQAKFKPLGDLIDSTCFSHIPTTSHFSLGHLDSSSKKQKGRRLLQRIKIQINPNIGWFSVVDCTTLYCILSGYKCYNITHEIHKISSLNQQNNTAMFVPTPPDPPVARINAISCPWRSRTFRPRRKLWGGEEHTPPIPYALCMEYLPTWTAWIYAFHVGKYSSPMEHMGMVPSSQESNIVSWKMNPSMLRQMYFFLN